MEKPILQYITEHIQNGALPEDFSLPKDTEEAGRVRFADGALDGIHMYHMSGSKVNLEELESIVNCISKGEKEEAAGRLLEFLASCTAIGAIDELQSCIFEHKEELNPENIYQFAVEQMTGGTNNEMVKFGMSVLEIFNMQEELKAAVRILALSDEFTLFALFLMRSWENADQEIFNIAVKVKGWGRIHAIEKLEQVTPEMSRWLLTEGIQNNVMPEYSALTCFEKSELRTRLAKHMDREELRAAGKIFQSMISEGPVAGISALEDAEEVLLSYMKRLSGVEYTPEDYEIILCIRDYARGKSLELEKICSDILSHEKCAAVLYKAMEKGTYFRLAKELGLKYRDVLYRNIIGNFDENYHYAGMLLEDGYYVEELVGLFEEKLPLEEMKAGPADELGLEPEFENYRRLILIIQELKDKPLQGIRLLDTALLSPVVNNRNMALNVLEAWSEREQKTLRELSEKLYETAEKSYSLEVREDVRERLKKILNQ